MKNPLPLVVGVIAAGAALAAQAAPTPLAGSWKQSSNKQELTLRPQMKIKPVIAPGYGMVVGTTGYGGGATATVIENTLVPVQTQRTMNLTVAPDGRFVWEIIKVAATIDKKPGCTGRTHEVKEGTVQVAGGKATFNITGGRRAYKDGCEASRNSVGDISPSRESYNVAISGGSARITGTGGVDWAFRKG